MSHEQTVVIVGASARAAAFSALRAGLRPWCIDLFADADLRARCPVSKISSDHYPNAIPAMVREGPPGPFLYAGGLENHPGLVDRIARQRLLWGNSHDVLKLVRDPFYLARIFHDADIRYPAVARQASELSSDRHWLVKPRRGAGGTGIHPHTSAAMAPKRGCYFQQFLNGPSWSAVYVGVHGSARLIGVSRQLVGEPWLHARPFQYCGSIGTPEETDRNQRQALQHIGDTLARACHLVGLFGVDCVMHNGMLWPVEVNPRYTASVEVLEFALGMSALAVHQRAFEPTAVPQRTQIPRPHGVVGKSILFARTAFVFPDNGPWNDAVKHPPRLAELPSFADIPEAGQRIEAGAPILSFFAVDRSEDECERRLRQVADELVARLEQ